MLEPTASDETLGRAAAANQTSWFERTAEAAGGIVRREDGVTWTCTPSGAVFAFPRLSQARLEAVLPRFLADTEGVREASCWSALPTEPAGLGEALREAGFRDGWQAHWMAVPVDEVADVPVPDGIRVDVVDGEWAPTDLPWDSAASAAVQARFAAESPRRIWRVAAWSGEEPVGHATLNVTTGALGVAGIYDMGVAANSRRRGIGSALTSAVCALGRQAGCRIATLNATAEGELLYRTLGFRSVGFAQTWWR